MNYTRSISGRRELTRCGFVGINCLEAGRFCALARRARAGGGAGRRSGRGRAPAPVFSERWRPLGFGDGLSREEAAL